MTTSALNPQDVVHAEHRGWKLQVRLLRSLSAESQGWVCYATRPASSQDLNLGRWDSCDLALEQGRAYVDRRAESPTLTGLRPNVLKRRI